MIITVLEAQVQQHLWEKLKKTYYDKTRTIPNSILQSYLAQDQSTPTTWQIITVWRSQEDLDSMRNSGETPTGIRIFQNAEATPQLSIFTVAQTAQKTLSKLPGSEYQD